MYVPIIFYDNLNTYFSINLISFSSNEEDLKSLEVIQEKQILSIYYFLSKVDIPDVLLYVSIKHVLITASKILTLVLRQDFLLYP